MAIGDDAQDEGMDLVPVNGAPGSPGKVRQGPQEFNRTRDYIAQKFWAAKSYADGLFASISLSWGSITGKPSTFPPSSHALSSHSGTLPASSLSSGTMTGNLGVTGNTEMNGNLRSSGARANPVASWLNVGVDPSGFIGQTSSARRFKQNITDFDAAGDIDQLRPRTFAWRKYPDLVDHGVIAEELIEAGYDWLVTRTEDGAPLGVRYEMLAIALIPELQALRARVRALEERP